VNETIAESNRAFLPEGNLMRPMGETIRAGRAGGLPFDSLVTDVVVGCLPVRTACYGNCFAAMASFAAGIDFGVQAANVLDETLLRADLAALPAGQRFLRIGWNSDPSWDWALTARIAAILRESGRHTVAVTKSFKRMDASVLAALVEAGVEIRVSVSAFDMDSQLRRRMETLLRYRDAGGVSVPLVMTTRFADPALQARQDALVEAVLRHDLPAAENSLRFQPGSPVVTLLDADAVRPLAESNDLWCGRLYDGRLTVPTTTSLPASYSGLHSAFLSRIPQALLDALFAEPVRTHAEVLLGPPLHKPTQCGVPRL
jgi:hypothetical protein